MGSNAIGAPVTLMTAPVLRQTSASIGSVKVTVHNSRRPFVAYGSCASNWSPYIICSGLLGSLLYDMTMVLKNTVSQTRLRSNANLLLNRSSCGSCSICLVPSAWVLGVQGGLAVVVEVGDLLLRCRSQGVGFRV